MAAICGVGHRDAPPIHVFQIATLNAHVVKPGNSGFRLVCWHEGSEVNATVVHMLVVHIAVHMTHCKIAQVDMAKGTAVLRHHRHTGSVHTVESVVDSVRLLTAVGDRQVRNLDAFAVIKQHGAGYISGIFVSRVVQGYTVVLEPQALPVDMNLRFYALAIGVDANGVGSRGVDITQVQILAFESTATLQQDAVAGRQRLTADRIKAAQGALRGEAAVCIVARTAADIINRCTVTGIMLLGSGHIHITHKSHSLSVW